LLLSSLPQVLWRSAGLATSSPYLASHPLETTLVYVGKLSPEVTDEQLRSAANKCSNHKVSSGIQIKTKVSSSALAFFFGQCAKIHMLQRCMLESWACDPSGLRRMLLQLEWSKLRNLK